MAGVTNIGGGNDRFNRYKMPTLVPKVEGKGNGIKTRIVNLTQIGRSLHRPASYMCKFFGCELGAQTKIDDGNGVYIVNGAHNARDLTAILEKFINMFVLCENCKLPETDLKVKKNGNILQKCNACGTTSLCDMSHKLCTYISNNPPYSGKGGKTGGKSKEDRRSRKKSKKMNERDHRRAAEEDFSINDSSSTVKDPALADITQSEPMLFIPGDTMADLDKMLDGGMEPVVGGDEDVVWSVDTSKEAQEARMKEIGGAAAILDRVKIGDEKQEKELKVRRLRTYMDDGKKVSRILNKSEKLFGEDSVVAGIMDAVILDETVSTIPRAVEEKAVTYLNDVGNVGRDLGAWIDETCETDTKLCKIVPHMWKAFFDADIVSEEEVVAWYEKDGCKGARDASREFVVWLKEAEEESEDEEDED